MMDKASPSRRCVSAALSAALLLSSWGPVVSSAAARQVAGKASSVSVVPQLGLLPAGIGAPALGPPAALSLTPSLLSLTPALVAPSLISAAAPVPVVPAAAVAVASALESALEAVAPAAAGEAYGRAAAEDFARRVTGEELPTATVISMTGRTGLRDPTVGADSWTMNKDNLKKGPDHLSRPAPTPPEAALPTKPEGEKREAFFPLWLAALSGAIWSAMELARWGSSALGAQSAGPAAGTTALAVAAVSAMALTGAFALNTVVDAAVFVAAMRRGREIGDAQLRAFLRAEVLEGRLDGNAAALVKPYRPDNRYKDFTFAFASRGLIWVRPELAATPWLLRRVLLHELHHMRVGAPRGPPRGAVRGVLSALLSEARARAVEFKGPGALKRIKVPALQRALTQTQTSLRLPHPYEILVLNPDTKEFEDPALYDGLSDGAARVTVLKDSAPIKALAEGRRYRAIVLGRAARALPEPKTKEALRLEAVLRQLDSLSLLATRLVARGGAFDRTPESRAWADLVDRASRLRESGSRPARRAFAGEVRKLWRQIASQRLNGVGVAELIDGLYGGLLDRGFAFLSFGPDDHGVVSWEKLLRYWEAEDGGEFRVTRVDLEDGGHLLILRKVEARVGLWLRPTSGGRITTSVANASLTEEGRMTARKSLEDAGLGSQLELFDKMEVVVRHVFGADVGRQEIYVTVPRRNASAIRKYVNASAEILHSETHFQVHLMDTAGLHGVKPVWQAGITGAAGSIFWIDTGADSTHEDFGGRLDIVDVVAEGSEDWIGHGTHIVGISISGNEGFLGMAKAAKGTMAKVFSRDQPGASDGDIMAAAVIGQKRGVDVISLSLGSRGSSADNLAEFFSSLTHRKNAAGEYPIVTASAGNAGPFDRTLSQPGAGVDVIAVGSLTKSLDDGVPEYSFFSSSGFDIDRRFAVKRYRFKPDLGAIGGDVVTRPGSAIVYLFGIFSARSKDAPRAASDLEDGKHTGMSGTSQSNAATAAMALLVKLALRAVGALTPAKAGAAATSFLPENLPFAVKAILMRTATDVGIPVAFQGAGLVNAWAAVSLVSECAGRALVLGVKRLWRRLTSGAPAGAPEGWSWLERLKAVQDAEDRVFREAELAKSEARSRQEEDAPDESSEEPPDRSASGGSVHAEVQRRFNAARDAEVPRLLEALQDSVWLVRFKAAFALMNLRAPAAAAALAKAGLHDSDGRVRQMAFLALAEISTLSTSALLQKAAGASAWDVGVYAAYALTRRGDRSQVARVLKELGRADKSARFTSAWLLGQIGGHATAAEAEGLSARVRDRAERGNIRHLTAAALSNLADAAPEALSDRVVTDLLDAAGLENLALTSTIAKVFPVAVRSKAFVARLRAEPLKSIVTDFVVKNRNAIGRPGALSGLVSLLARAAAIPLDAPTAPMDSSGLGVSGVDSAMGPVDLIAISPPYGGEIPEIDGAMLMRFETTARAALPLSRALWLSVPEHKLYALTVALEHKGWSVRRSLPYYPLSRAPAGGGVLARGGLILDLGDGETPPEIPAGADFSLVRVRAAGGVSEVRLMAALERVAMAAKGGPALVALALAAPTTRRAPLSMLIDRLVAAGIGVVVGAGNAGPELGTVAAPGDSGLAVVVAADWWKEASATRTAVAVPLYSLRREKDDPGIGKFSDLGRYYRGELAGQGVDAVLLLPHFAKLGESPYAPVSLYAISEDQIDWSEVDEARGDPALLARLAAPLAERQSVHYEALRAREAAVARAAFARFQLEEIARGSARARDFRDFAARHGAWLDEYAEFRTLSKIIGKPLGDWTPEDERAARASAEFAPLTAMTRWTQWLAYGQLKTAVDEVHAAGGRVLLDMPMFRAKNGVDAWKRPELFADLRTRNPGVVNAWTREDWKDLALWRWSRIKADGYAAALGPYRHWLAFGFDGARADALHFAYPFGNGQQASGDEPGDDYTAGLSAVLSEYNALPLAEAFEGKDVNARRLGFMTIGGDWKQVSSHDDPRGSNFLSRYFDKLREPSSGATAKFVAYTLGDEWLDPFSVKWRYRIPLPSDPDYRERARFDARPQLRALKAIKDGGVWKAPEAVRAAFAAAADTFVKRDAGGARLWAAGMDWFLEEWGRDALISLPGLLLSRGRYDDAKSVLRRFSGFERGGLIPNRIGDGTKPEYNTADAPMWFVQAVKSHVEAAGDWALALELAPTLRRIIAGYENGASYERYGRDNRIFMDVDGLVVTPAQATWMDADPEGKDKPVTPRDGKAVEINALWYSNLRFMAAVERRLGDPGAGAPHDALADRVKASFNEKFWFVTEENRAAWGSAGRSHDLGVGTADIGTAVAGTSSPDGSVGGALRDVVEGDPHGSAIRPNMLFAVSHGGDLLAPERRRAVVLAATRDLLTRKGPRTLSDRDSYYRARYETQKPPIEKDQAYHQGTVWPWLMGAYAEALASVRRDLGWDEARVRAETRALITPLVEDLVGRPEGSLPEVYDGGAADPALKNFSLDDPAGLAPIFARPGPEQNPGGTRSQAWSVAEVLRLIAAI